MYNEQGKSYASYVHEHLDRKNIKENTIKDFNLKEIVLTILLKNKDIERFCDFLSNNCIKLSDLPKSGNFIQILNKKTGISLNTLNELLSITGIRKGRVLGKGEILLSIFLDDVKVRDISGDLNWCGLNLEVKGSNGRFGERNREISSDTLIVDYIKNNNITDFRLDSILNNTVDKQHYLQDIIKKNFNVTGDIETDNIRSLLSYYYIAFYAQKKNIDAFFLLNTERSKGRYRFFKTNEIKEYILNGTITVQPFYIKNMNPSLNTIK
jgi:hypothetical protein